MLMSIENCKEGIMLRFTDRIQRSHDLSQYLSILTPLTSQGELRLLRALCAHHRLQEDG